MTESQNHIPEEVQLWIRLEVFLCLTLKKQRDKLYKNELSENDPRFVHYTSADAAFKIIRSKRLWMRNATCMSDYREVQHGFDILAKFFSDKSKINAFSKALDECAPGAALEAVIYLISGGISFAYTLTLPRFPNTKAQKICTGGSLCGVLSEITPLALLSLSRFLGSLGQRTL